MFDVASVTALVVAVGGIITQVSVIIRLLQHTHAPADQVHGQTPPPDARPGEWTNPPA